MPQGLPPGANWANLLRAMQQWLCKSFGDNNGVIITSFLLSFPFTPDPPPPILPLQPQIAPSQGMAKCLACKAPRGVSDPTFTECMCSPGTFYSDLQCCCASFNAGVTPFLPGFRPNATDEDQCLACPAGYEKPLPGFGNCSICAKGRYAEVSGTPSCERCPAGRYEARASMAWLFCVSLVLLSPCTSAYLTGSLTSLAPPNAKAAMTQKWPLLGKPNAPSVPRAALLP